MQTWTYSDREGALVHTRTDCARCTEHCHTREEEGRKAGRIKELKRGIGSFLAVRVVDEYEETK